MASPSAVPMLLTGTALEVWDQLASGSEVEEAAIVGALADRFGVDEEDMAVDVAVFLRLLATSGAVEAVVRAR
ncbi:PqqD family protein [Rathayibacter oskolensis]|uniref:PqqD family protein n=1 Tax=Rathayibacter oskolensis TaxID=1891671 RepID=UPI0013FD48D0|nr:PqqD family protein [Rathayibacter oskolensis]